MGSGRRESYTEGKLGQAEAKHSWDEKEEQRGFPGGAVVENPPANAEDTGSSPGLGGSHMPRSN